MTGSFLVACALSPYEEGDDGSEGVDEAEDEEDRKEWGREVILARGSDRMIIKNKLRASGSGEVGTSGACTHQFMHACLALLGRPQWACVQKHGVCFSARCCYSSASSA